MRPYLQFHASPEMVLTHLIQKDQVGPATPKPELIGGTIPWRGAAATLRQITTLATPPHEKPYIHLTLSAPVGRRFGAPDWQDFITAALIELGLPPRQLPWLAFRHADKPHDHVHVLIIARSFTGRVLSLPHLKARCEAAHRRICQIAGLEMPDYPIAAHGPRLALWCPLRRQKTPQHARLAAGITQVFRKVQPEEPEALRAALLMQGGIERCMNAASCPITAGAFVSAISCSADRS